MRELTLGEIHTVQLGLLERLAEHCEKNGITYYLAYGSLLGAIRHAGFIPWDDDADVWLVRDQMNRFLATFQEDDTYKLVAAFDRKYGFAWPKLVDKRTAYYNERRLMPDDYGAALDLFPLDEFVGFARWRRAYMTNLLRNIAWADYWPGASLSNGQKVKKALRPLVKLLPETLYDETAWERIIHPAAVEPGDRYYNYHARKDVFQREVYLKQWFGEGKLLPFEKTHFFRVPDEPEAILEWRYGKNWRIPKEEGRHAHAFLRDGCTLD